MSAESIDADHIDHDIARNRDSPARPHDRSRIPIERHPAALSGENGGKPLAAQQGRRLQRQCLQLATPGAGDHGHHQRSQHRNDQHHRHHLDQDEAGT